MDEAFIGEIFLIAFNYAPPGFALCNGQLLSISEHQLLFSLIGTTYGGNGATTFALPDLRGKVPRYTSVRVQAWDRNGQELDYVATGFHARVIQHEFDHLNGKLYVDRMRDLTTLSFLQEFARYWLPARGE